MAKKVSGLNMLILVGGLILLFLFFWGAYKVKDGFDSCGQTITNGVSSTLYETKEESITDITKQCTSIGKTMGDTTPGLGSANSCYYSNWKVSNCNSKKDPNGKWRSVCSCTGTLDST
jgi:hypothetical protein